MEKTTSNRTRSQSVAIFFKRIALLGSVLFCLGTAFTCATFFLVDMPHAVADPKIDEDKAEMLKKLQAVRSLKLAEALELEEDSETMLKLERLLTKHDAKLIKAEEQLRKQASQLRRGVSKGNIGDKELEQMADELLEHRRTVDKLRFKRIKEASQLLKGERRARLLFFLPEFERQFHKAIKKILRERRKGHRKRSGPKFDKPRKDHEKRDRPRDRRIRMYD